MMFDIYLSLMKELHVNLFSGRHQLLSITAYVAAARMIYPTHIVLALISSCDNISWDSYV